MRNIYSPTYEKATNESVNAIYQKDDFTSRHLIQDISHNKKQLSSFHHIFPHVIQKNALQSAVNSYSCPQWANTT